jgi:hypothetical protein
MVQGLLSLCLFFISVIGILLFRPAPLESLTRYSEPGQLEERKQVTRKMVELLEKHPEVLRQTQKMSTTSLGKPLEPARPGSIDSPAPPPFPFQGQSMDFRTQREMKEWVSEKMKDSPRDFIDQITRTEMDSATKLELLSVASQADGSEATTQAIKQSSLAEARKLLARDQDQDHDMTQKFLEFYIEKESDPRIGKETVDELLRSRSNPPEQP